MPALQRLVSPGLLAFLAGAMAVLAFAPFSFSFLTIASLSLLFWLWRDASPREAFHLGWLFGLGLMGFGVFWLHISIDQFGNVGLALAVLITLLFVAAMALYYGLMGWLCAKYGGEREWLRLLLCYPALWVLIEWVRGWFLSGFPWLSFGYSQLETPLHGYAPLLGVYGISWAVAVSAGLIILLLASLQPFLAGRTSGQGGSAVRPLILPLFGLVALWFGGDRAASQEWTRVAGEPIRVSLIQGNIPQERKWLPEQFKPTLDLYLGLSREHMSSDLIVWPETAIPAFYHQVDKSLLEPLGEELKSLGVDLLLGIAVRHDDGRYFNAMASLGRNKDAYYKRHLVPFGEFLPLKSLLDPLIDFLKIPMSDFSAGDPSKNLLQLAGYPMGISICYEDAFGEEVIRALPDAAFLINASNDAWFGDSLAPHQHLEIARMRALESGRFLLRATNTGVSAIIDPTGGIVGVSPAFEQDVLTHDVTPMQGLTPFAKYGNRAIVVAMLLLLGIGLVLGRRNRAD
jgi:apolipoprotein N-acyltransferase